MTKNPHLSIVTPTRGNFSDYWIEQLLKVKGNVQFILVYPPNTQIKQISDPRIKVLTSPYKGEVMQRFTGLLNATGDYVLALDDDDFVHPDILNLTIEYFKQFPESWALRPKMKTIAYTDQEAITKPWADIPDISQLEAVSKRPSEEQYPVLQELPIAPLKNKFNSLHLVNPYLERKDMHGVHMENFNNKIWKNELVQQALTDLSGTMRVIGALTWIPFWSLDRLLSLFIQAKFFEEGTIIGHWLHAPEQIRYIKTPQTLKQEFRLILPADVLLLKRFPQYGYFWNLFFEQFWVAVKKIGRNLTSLKK